MTSLSKINTLNWLVKEMKGIPRQYAVKTAVHMDSRYFSYSPHKNGRPIFEIPTTKPVGKKWLQGRATCRRRMHTTSMHTLWLIPRQQQIELSPYRTTRYIYSRFVGPYLPSTNRPSIQPTLRVHPVRPLP
jgi:hypothetical protein